jgi:hypothetical protein
LDTKDLLNHYALALGMGLARGLYLHSLPGIVIPLGLAGVGSSPFRLGVMYSYALVIAIN